ncbi:hypothetical protein F4818DRAFT_434584 [Hypoxylon cercidicola]|nr:hypothetical protein F4818DRAFT_434584 [Hypoxylon cercidicola]
MRRLKGLLRRRSFDDGSTGSTNTDNRRIAPLDTRRSLDTRKHHGNSENSHRSHQSTNISPKAKEPGPTETPLDTISEVHSQANQLEDTETDITPNPISSRETTREKRPGNPSARILNNESIDSLAMSVEKEKATAPETYDSESHDPEEVYEDCLETPSLHGVIDLTNTVDTDEITTHAPAVTHETVRPHIHEIVEEQIYRDIHNHEVYHRIQPIYDVEFLPARHFVPGREGGLVEMSEDDLPDCTGPNQKWQLSKRSPLCRVPSPSKDSPELPELALEQNANPESIDPEPIGPEELQPTKSRGTFSTGSEFGDLYQDSWQASAARMF